MADGNFETTKSKTGKSGPADGHGSALLRLVPDFEKIDGWLKLPAAELLFAAAASIRVGCIVEIGSYRGRSTVALCAGSSAGGKIPVFAIDPHEHFVGIKGGIFGPNDRKSFFRTMLTTKFSNIVRLINTSSQILSPGWDKPISLLFIDGDHRYEAVLADFAAWRPHLMDHAIVLFHDADGAGPSLVINDLLREGYLAHVQTVGRLAMFQFNAVDSRVNADDIQHSGLTPIVAEGAPALADAPPALAIGHKVYFSRGGNFLYQAIHRCACLPIKAALRELEGIPETAPTRPGHGRRHARAPTSGVMTAAEEASILSGQTDCFNFVVVRDPYTRMAGAYADKIHGSHNREGSPWRDLIEAAAATHGIELSDRITFEEFIRVVCAQPVADMDPHWRPQYYEGQFARIKFDFIGRMESISTDLTYIFERIGAPPEIMHKAIQPHGARDANLAIWSTVGAQTRKHFLDVFAIDFDTLRYPMRHASVLFLPVNLDRPKPVPLATAVERGGARRMERARRRMMEGAAGNAAGGDMPDPGMLANE